MKKPYRVWITWTRSRRFATLEEAMALANRIFAATKIVVSVTKDEKTA